MFRPQGEGVRGPQVVPVGGVITVDVGPNDSSVEIQDGVSGNTRSYDVEPGKTTQIPVPPVPAGTALIVTVGRGRRARQILIEVISTAP